MAGRSDPRTNKLRIHITHKISEVQGEISELKYSKDAQSGDLRNKYQSLLLALKRVLEKLERGLYGFCCECRNYIATERLEKNIFAVRCERCQRESREFRSSVGVR